MGAGYGRELKSLLKKHSCTFIRNGKGDHQIWFSPKTNREVTLDYGTKNRHIANQTLKQAGINHKF
jgi:hypothetical protein